MSAAFGPVIPATSRVTVMLVYAEETPSDFAREVPEGTRYVVKMCGRTTPISWHLWLPFSRREVYALMLCVRREGAACLLSDSVPSIYRQLDNSSVFCL